VAKHIPIAAQVPGCPPRPTEILSAILAVAPTVFADYEVKKP
jgi:energy-converting hydrogenase A subunit N